ncbi:hypothetical protein LQZ19_18115 [Treponema primitia]|uniref:uroporphyrinogen decarboxylase family protein n=1 Tax=Treponema primitia TaxID=88058 RepID=UPI00397EA193
MNFSEREDKTLSFSNIGLDRGAVEETFEPWDFTVANWEKEGLKTDFNQKLRVPTVPTEVGYISKDRPVEFVDHYYSAMVTDPVFRIEQQFGLDPVKRMAFRIPFLSYEEKILEETPEYFTKLDIDGCIRKYYRGRDLFTLEKSIVSDEKTWEQHKAHILETYHKYCTDEAMERIYGPYREGCAKGDFSIRFRLTGFFWAPRDLFGVEPHLYAFYDYPEVIKDINRLQLDIYREQMGKILKIITPTVLFFEEDLSGKTGPMISGDCFDEFVAPCYKEIIPFLKEQGVKNVFVDTDGDFTLLIPNFRRAGVDGFLPVDVNAGVDLVAVRKKFPDVKFIGGFNKLEIVKGPEAIDAEFERLLPVIKQGGYMTGVDHQPAPSTPLKHYQYYLKKLGEIMRQYRGENAK